MCLAVVQGTPAWAQEDTSSVNIEQRAALMGLAKEFSTRIGANLEKADNYLKGLRPEDLRRQQAFNNIQDGELMILKVTLRTPDGSVRDRVELDQPVLAIKHGYDVMMSLADFVVMANFAIRVDGEAGTASGWYVAEGQKFKLDMAEKRVEVNGKVYAISDEDVWWQDGEIYVKGETLSKWFGFDAEVNLSGQHIAMFTEQKWPAQARLERLQRAQGSNRMQRPKPKEPFMKLERKVISPPNLNVTMRQRIENAPDRDTVNTTSYSVQGTNDLLGYTAETTMSGQREQPLDSLYLRLSKSSSENDLLGPLKAGYYELNDIRSVRVPGAGSAGIERGVRITNKNQNITYDTVTTIEGMAPPGWDVELYRGDQYIGAQVMEDNGRYFFENVPLFAGENRFRIVKYGLQGEIREDTESVFVAPSTYGQSGGVYDVSVSQQKKRTYSATESDGQDVGSPHFAATYDRQLNNHLALRTGIRALEQAGEMNTYVYGGLAHIDEGLILNSDTVIKNDASFTQAFSARRKIWGDHNISAGLRYQSDRFTTTARTSDFDTVGFMTLNASLLGAFDSPYLPNHISYRTSNSYRRSNDGRSLFSTNNNFSTRLNDMLVNTSVQAQFSPDGVSSGDGDNIRLHGATSLRGRFMRTNWRSTVSYDAMPEMRIDSLNLNVSRTLKRDLRAELDLEHELEDSYTIGELAVNYRTDKATFTPRVSYDSDQVMQATMNVNFGLAYDPYAKDLVVKSSALNSRGAVSAFVFLDKDGDMAFSDGDEPLEGVFVDAVQSGKVAATDEKGEVFLSDLPANRLTDVVIEASSAFDPTWVVARSGVSIRPRPGSIARVVFPIQRGGEIDGTLYTAREDGEPRSLGGVRLHLYNMNGKRVASALAATDGYYYMTQIPPGRYYMLLNEEDALYYRVTPELPQLVEVGYDGLLLYGQNIVFEKSRGNMAVTISPEIRKPYAKMNPDVEILKEPVLQDVAIMNLGNYKSSLMRVLMWYKLKVQQKLLTAGMELLDNPDALGENPLRVYLPQGNPKEAWERCRAFDTLGYKCSVEIIPYDPSKAKQAGGDAVSRT